MAKLFISYRRADSPYIAGILYDRLVAIYGEESVFYDVDSIPIGVDFRKFISDMISGSDVVLVVIGHHWLDVQEDTGQRRLDQSTDFVRLEVEAALKSDPYVIPVIVDGAALPTEADLPDSLKQLAYRNATQIRAGRDMDKDLDQLMKDIELILGNEVMIATQTMTQDTRQGKPRQQETIAPRGWKDIPGDRANRFFNILIILSFLMWMGVNIYSLAFEHEIWFGERIFWEPIILAAAAFLLKYFFLR